MKLLWILPLLLVLFAGCANISVNEGLVINMQADPDSVFVGKDARLFIDVLNNDVKSYTDLNVRLFDTGLMTSTCQPQPATVLRPGGFFTIQCILTAPALIDGSTTTEAHVNAKYKSSISGAVVLRSVSPDEYDRLKNSGKYPNMPSSFSFADKNMEVSVTLDDNPMVYKTDKRYFMHINIRNIGNGLISEISVIGSAVNGPAGLVKCEDTTIRPIGKEFPTIACELYPQTSRLTDYNIVVDIPYTYDVSHSTNIRIVK